jgi:K+-sensing histidine kinase KdpD
MALAAPGLRGGRGAVRHHYVVAMQWLMAFEAANLVMLYLLGVVIIACSTAAGRRCWRR